MAKRSDKRGAGVALLPASRQKKAGSNVQEAKGLCSKSIWPKHLSLTASQLAETGKPETKTPGFVPPEAGKLYEQPRLSPQFRHL